ncbi:MAG: fused MFS/spermidine synthase [Gammaproteobacteria bacterium]|nr:fused MFS/spermidine synthase [Gammaproteobacteria bacterium]
MTTKVKHATTKSSAARRTRALVLIFFFISGSCGLVYEIVWMKMLTVVIGNTVFSTTTVLTAFMGGLALGSFLAGRFADRFGNPLRVYGILEGIIGVYAFALPSLIAGTEPIFRLIYQNFDTSYYVFSLVRFLVCGTILLVPTTLMGATLPILSKYFVEKQTDLGWTVGKLYGVNTFGAALGAFAAGFVLTPLLGINFTIYTAGVLNLLIAAAVLMRQRKFARAGSGPSTRELKNEKRARDGATVESSPSTVTVIVMIAIGLSGVAAMAYQIAWTRVLSLLIGSSVYAFSLIVTAFICGLALGSVVIARFIDRRRDLVFGFALVQIAAGASALVMVPVLGTLPPYMAELIYRFPDSFERLHMVEFAVVLVLLLIPTFMMGATFPIAAKICARDTHRIGRFVGNVYAVNTVGAIVGSFAAGFVLIPWLGTQNTIFIAVAINFVAAAMLFLRAPTFSLAKRATVTAALVVIAAFGWRQIASWDVFLLTTGPYIYADLYKDFSAKKGIGLKDAMKEGKELLFFKEGIHAAVAVKKTSGGDLALDINGKTDATARGDARTQLALGHIPLLLHEYPKDVMIIGLGSGMTLAAVEAHPVDAIDVVELEPAVVEASEYFRAFNRDALSDPRVNLKVEDGRNYLAFAGKQYDVIISEPTNVWISGMASLFTEEFFELTKSHLRDGGLMCQWLHAYSISPDDFKIIVRTFHAVYPQTMMWEADFGNDYLLIGTVGDLDVDYDVLENRLSKANLRADLSTMNLTTPASLMGKLLLTGNEISRYTAGAPLHTDDNILLEYSAPKALFEDDSPLLLRELYAYGLDYRRALQALGWGDNELSFEKDTQAMFEARTELVNGYISYLHGKLADAAGRLERALALNPNDYDVMYNLANVYSNLAEQSRLAQNHVAARDAISKCIAIITDFVASDGTVLSHHFELNVLLSQAYLKSGVLANKRGSFEEAAQLFRKSLEGQVRFAEAYNNLGTAYEGLGRLDWAMIEYQRALEASPNHMSARVNIGNLLLKEEQYEEAIENYLLARDIRPNHATVHYNLGVAYFKQGELAKASKVWTRTLELNPEFAQAQQALDTVRERMNTE